MSRVFEWIMDMIDDAFEVSMFVLELMLKVLVISAVIAVTLIGAGVAVLGFRSLINLLLGS